MIKFILPAIILFLIVLFWEKISELAFKKFNIKVNFIVLVVFLLIIGMILLLLYY